MYTKDNFSSTTSDNLISKKTVNQNQEKTMYTKVIVGATVATVLQMGNGITKPEL